MAADLNPERAIVPIVRASHERPVIEILGTGFFVGTGEVLHVITAKHVITSFAPAEGEHLAVVFRGTTGIACVSIAQVVASTGFDIAAGAIDKSHIPEAVPIAIGDIDPPLSANVFSFEYSSTRIERTEKGGTLVSFEPYAHKGNIVRRYVSTFPETTPTPSILTSFPALRGASGAPILAANATKSEFGVVGMTVANLERHLLPAQVVEVHDGDTFSETTSYFLPYGKALGREVVAMCLEQMNVPFEYCKHAIGDE
jgi:hypothetical protein